MADQRRLLRLLEFPKHLQVTMLALIGLDARKGSVNISKQKMGMGARLLKIACAAALNPNPNDSFWLE